MHPKVISIKHDHIDILRCIVAIRILSQEQAVSAYIIMAKITRCETSILAILIAKSNQAIIQAKGWHSVQLKLSKGDFMLQCMNKNASHCITY